MTKTINDRFQSQEAFNDYAGKRIAERCKLLDTLYGQISTMSNEGLKRLIKYAKKVNQ